MSNHSKPAGLILPLLPKKVQPYAKAAVALLGALAGLAVLYGLDDPRIAAGIQVLTALGVFAQPNGEAE